MDPRRGEAPAKQRHRAEMAEHDTAHEEEVILPKYESKLIDFGHNSRDEHHDLEKIFVRDRICGDARLSV